MCDYFAHGVWDRSGRAIHPVCLPISEKLGLRLLDWQARYDATIDSLIMDDKPRFVADGFAIAIAIKAELPGWRVLYHDESRDYPDNPGIDFEKVLAHYRPWVEYEITDEVVRTGKPPDNYPGDLTGRYF